MLLEDNTTGNPVWGVMKRDPKLWGAHRGVRERAYSACKVIIKDKDMAEEERKMMEEARQMGPGKWTGMGKVKARPCLAV